MAKDFRIACIAIENITRDDGQQLLLNGKRAAALIDEAVAKFHPDLVLLPEFCVSGYNYHWSLWLAGETQFGPTVRMMADAAMRHNIHVAGSFLEVEGKNFFNSFVIVNPEGNICGKVRKSRPAGYERFYTIGDDSNHTIDCSFGRCGVLICYENMFPSLVDSLRPQNINLLLQPFCGPAPPDKLSLPFTETSSKAYTEAVFLLRQVGRCLHVPAAIANKSGQGTICFPPGIPFDAWEGGYTEHSAIMDADGNVLAAKTLGDRRSEIIAATVTLRQQSAESVPYIAHPWTEITDEVILKENRTFELVMPIIEFIGSIYYGSQEPTRAIIAKKIRYAPNGHLTSDDVAKIHDKLAELDQRRRFWLVCGGFALVTALVVSFGRSRN